VEAFFHLVYKYKMNNKRMKFNNRDKENILKKELSGMTNDYLIQLLIYNGCVENTVNKIVSDFAPEGAVFNNLKNILK